MTVMDGTVIHWFKLTASRVNPNGNYTLWAIVVCQCSVISCSKCTPLVGMLLSAEVVCVYEVWEFFILSTHFWCELKTALKIVCFFFKSIDQRLPSRNHLHSFIRPVITWILSRAKPVCHLSLTCLRIFCSLMSFCRSLLGLEKTTSRTS